jgi:hypothetical protein
MLPEPLSRQIARLMALALRSEGLLREQTMQDYAELGRLGGVTRARMTQIMKLLDLAPDIQERLLFLPPLKGLNERSLRSVVRRIDWNEHHPAACGYSRHARAIRTKRRRTPGACSSALIAYSIAASMNG